MDIALLLSLNFTSMSATIEPVKVSFTKFTEDRENKFRDYLIEFWVDEIDMKLSLLLEQWLNYISLPAESMEHYDNLKKSFDSYDSKITADMLRNTYFLHQNSYLEKNGLTDTFDRTGTAGVTEDEFAEAVLGSEE